MRHLRVAALAAALLAGGITSAAAVNLEAIGGPGGGAQSFQCQDNERLVGIGARYGSWLDWVGPICAPISANSGWANAPRGSVWIPEKSKSIFEEIGSTWASFLPWNLPGTVKGWIGPKVVVGTRVPGMGGEGGHMVTLAVCPENFFVSGFDTVVLAGKNFVARVTLHCRNLQTLEESWVGLPQPPAGQTYYTITGRYCPEGEMASGIHGRAGIYVDAFGLSCRPTASKAFCDSYASQAVAQVKEAQQRKCGFAGARWTPNFNDHAGWCMALGGDRRAPNSEAAARTKELAACKAKPLEVAKSAVDLTKLDRNKGVYLPGGVQTPVTGDVVAGAQDKVKLSQPGAGVEVQDVGKIKKIGDLAKKKKSDQVADAADAAGARMVTVTGDVDVYDIPDGVGQVIGMLRQGQQVPLVLCRPDQWCKIRGNGPGGMAWVWGEFLAR